MHSHTLTLETLEERHLLALTAVDTTEHCTEVVDLCGQNTSTLNIQDYDLDDQAVRQTLFQLLNAESMTDEANEPNASEEAAVKKHKHHSKLGKLKQKISHEASAAKNFVSTQADDLKEKLSSDLDKLAAKLTPEEFRLELQKIEDLLKKGTHDLKNGITHGIESIESGILGIENKIDRLFTLPQACLTYYLAGGEDADPNEPNKALFAHKLDHLMQKGVARLESHADWVVHKLSEMPEGKRKEIFTNVIATSADISGAFAGEVSDFLGSHSEVNEDLLHYLTLLTHLSSKALKGTSWGLKLTSTGLKLATLGGFPELGIAAILVGSGGTVASYGSSLLGGFEGQLPGLADERSEAFSSGSKAGHQAQDIWKGMSDRLRNGQSEEASDMPKLEDYDLDDEEARQALLQVLNPTTKIHTDQSEEKPSSSHTKFSLGKLKKKITHDAQTIEAFLTNKTDAFKEEVAADIHKLKTKLTPEEIKAELEHIQTKLKQGAYGLKASVIEGIDRIESGMDGLHDKAEYLFSLPDACLTYYFASNQGADEDAHKTPFADKLDHWMQKSVSRLETHADWMVKKLTEMPEGKRKEVLTKIISTSAHASETVVGEISDFLETHQEINEDLLHYLTVLTHVSSMTLKGTSWGLKLASTGLKIAALSGQPEIAMAAIIVGAGATVTSVGSSMLGEFQEQLPHLADERSGIFTAGSEAGHQAQDIWSNMNNRLQSKTPQASMSPSPVPIQA